MRRRPPCRPRGLPRLLQIDILRRQAVPFVATAPPRNRQDTNHRLLNLIGENRNMKNLVFASLLCGTLAQMGTGCIVTSGDPPVPGYFDVAWTLHEGRNATAIQGCGQGRIAEVVAENVRNKQQYIDLFTCTNRTGLTSSVPPGDYDVWVNVYNDDQLASADLIAQSGFQRVTVFDGETIPLDFFFPAGGFFELTWSITDDFGPDAECADVGADGVSVLANLVGPNTAIDDVFDCFELQAITPQMLLGEYVLSVSLLDGQESLNQVSTAEPARLEYGNHVYEIGHFEFLLDE
jgi:hypothetical protein